MRQISVDPYGAGIMQPKGLTFLVKLSALSNICANILKQEMLSLGADAAVARGALTGKTRVSDCLLMGNLDQLNDLCAKLKRQPFGLSKVAEDLSMALRQYQKQHFQLCLGRHKLRLGRRTHLMGIINATPDSFSGDGIYANNQLEDVAEYVRRLCAAGADIIDVGGESSRPGARAVTLKEELRRTIPVIRIIARSINVPVSIDTCKPQVARQALDNGASLVNDITGLRDPAMARVIARHKAAVVLMHMKGRPRTMQKSPSYASLIDDIIAYLKNAIDKALDAGIKEDKIIIDPGIGFGKTLEHNLQIIQRLSDFRILGKPILIGPSRKSFIGKILGTQVSDRVFGSVASCCIAAKNGAHIVRVHDIGDVRQALKVADSINNSIS